MTREMERQYKERNRSDIPNTDGFRFIGVRHDGSLIDCTVERYGPHGLHRIKECRVSELRGWVSIK